MMKKILLGLLVAVSLPLGAQDKYAVVNFSANFMREKPDYDQENGDQALMGTVVKVEGKESYWVKITSPEPYTAWASEMGLVEMDKEGIDAYIAAPKYICTTEYTHVYSEPSDKSLRLSELVLGDIVRVWKEGKKGGWVGVMLPDGRTGYVRSKEVAFFADWAKSREEDPQQVLSMAKRFLGVPYMWGGTSIKNVDCSGLARSTYYMNGILLPRNASQQAKVGESVDISGVTNGDFSSLQPADLIFFGNVETRKVTHVGIYIGDGKFIHSSQVVRINSLREGESDYYSGAKRLLCARRILGNVDCGKGVVSMLKSKWYFPQSE